MNLSEIMVLLNNVIKDKIRVYLIISNLHRLYLNKSVIFMIIALIPSVISINGQMTEESSSHDAFKLIKEGITVFKSIIIKEILIINTAPTSPSYINNIFSRRSFYSEGTTLSKFRLIAKISIVSNVKVAAKTANSYCYNTTNYTLEIAIDSLIRDLLYAPSLKTKTKMLFLFSINLALLASSSIFRSSFSLSTSVPGSVSPKILKIISQFFFSE